MSIIPVHQRGYANPQLLAETDWLAQHLDDAAVRIVDARPPQQYDAAGHIPGAVNLPGTNGIPRTVDGEVASPEEFGLVAGKLGIGNNGTIIVYDFPNQHMGLVAWAFLYYGHQDVRLLDGGFEKWLREGCQVSTQEVSDPATCFHAQPVEAITARSAMQRPPMDVQKQFSGTRTWRSFTALAKGTVSLLPGRDISRARSISIGSS
jgi:thiosulfate/3-mercaptopyruvate sulfurtransferase